MAKKHLTLFKRISEYETFKKSESFVKPNVSYCEKDDKIYYSMLKNNTKEYLTIENTGEEVLTLSMKSFDSNLWKINMDSQVSISYQTDSTGWIETSDAISVNPNESVMIKANLVPEKVGVGSFVMEGETTCSVKGNVMSLLHGDDSKDKTDLTGYDGAFATLFFNCRHITDASELLLPATTLSEGCYASMFSGCTNLVSAPVLPATTLAESCYGGMFAYCENLTTAPELPATELAYSCYGGMFYGCTSLTTAPELPATTLADNCYERMFNGCTNLSNITMLATDISATDCLNEWVYGVASTGTLTRSASISSFPSGNSGIPYGWTDNKVY